MTRDHDALAAYLAERSAMPFEWRRNDCVAFAIGAMRAQTGRRISMRGYQYRSAAGAARALKKLGGMEAAVDRYLRRVPPSMAMRGDIAGVTDPELGLLLMVVEGQTLAGPCEQGIRRLPRKAMAVAWSVER